MNLVAGGFPNWAQVVVTLIAVLAALVGIVSGIGAALAFCLVIWPSIRNGERRARRVEDWLESSEGRRVISLLREKADLSGTPMTPEAFAERGSDLGGFIDKPGGVSTEL